MKLIIIAALLLSPVPVAKKVEPVEASRRLLCPNADGLGGVVGTGFYVAPNLIVTAAHVASGRSCYVGNELSETVYTDDYADIAIVRTATPAPKWLRVSCKRPRRGHVVHSVGFAGGGLWPVKRVFVAIGKYVPDTNVNFHGLARYVGEATGGMSGSAIMHRGRAVGVLTAGNNAEMYGRTFATTGLCK